MKKLIEEEFSRTKDIELNVRAFARRNNIEYDECSFSIKSTDNYIKTTSMEEFKLANEDINELYQDKEKIINEHLHIQQIYTILIRPKKRQLLDIKYKLEFDEYNVSPRIIIEPTSTIPYKKYKPKEIYLLLKKELNRIKAQNKIIIDIFDKVMTDTLKKFVKYIYSGKFVKRVSIPLFKGIQPQINRPSRLIMHFLDKESDEQLIEVQKGEVLVEFVKPIFGKSGFNAFGEYISTDIGKNHNDLEADIDINSIEIVEDDDKKLYKSKKKGYVKYTHKKLLVDNKVEVSKLSRVQKALSKDEDNNIEVRVSQNDSQEDSIGEGVELTSQRIHVNGHVGANSIVEAVELIIDGATHQDSTQFAKDAQINRHKGTLRCNNAKIKLLEGGEVHATTVDVEASLGGTIRAKDVTIGHVKNNLKVYASNSITVRLVSGEDNLFKINYKEVPILNSKLDLIQEDIDDLKYSLEEAKRHNISQVENIKSQIKALVDERNEIKNSTLKAKITIQKPLIGLNIITFVLNSTDEITYKTLPREYEPFYLEVNEDEIILHPVNKTLIIK